MTGVSLCGLDVEEILTLIQGAGFNIQHAVSISNSLYKKNIHDISGFPQISNKLKDELAKVAYPGLFMPSASRTSADGTIKFLFRNAEGLYFETVYLPEKKRNTVCVSTQSGCRMGCPFCISGRYGFHGNLSVRDIVNQIISLPVTGKITHVVFMGMGEPMDNLENVLKACKIITSQWGLAFSPANVTVSSVGITPGIKRFLDESNCNLTVSLHSPYPEERNKIIPVEKKYPVHEIIELMKNSVIPKKRRMSLAYVMIRDANDSGKHLEELKNLLKGSKIRVNLLPYHSVGMDGQSFFFT